MKVQKLFVMLAIAATLIACKKSSISGDSNLTIAYESLSQREVMQSLEDTLFVTFSVINMGVDMNTVRLQDSRRDSVEPFDFPLASIPKSIVDGDDYKAFVTVPVPLLFVRPYVQSPEKFYYEITVYGSEDTSNTVETDIITVSQ